MSRTEGARDWSLCPPGTTVVGLSRPAAAKLQSEIRQQNFLILDEDCLRPAREVEIPGFKISTFPVTFDEFLEWRLGRGRSIAEGFNRYWEEKFESIDRLANLPVVGATLEEAHGFACSVGARLPYRIEWIYAARGPVKLEQFSDENFRDQVPQNANWSLDCDSFEEPTLSLRPVAESTIPTWCGARDMWGNADELTLSKAWFSPATRQRIGEYECERRHSYMECGMMTTVQDASFSSWIVTGLSWNDNGLLIPYRPGMTGFRLAMDVDFDDL